MNPASPPSRFRNTSTPIGGLSLLLLVAMVLQIPAMRVEAAQLSGQFVPEAARQLAEPIVVRKQTQPKRQGELPIAARLAFRLVVARLAAESTSPPAWAAAMVPDRPPVRITSPPPPARA